MKEKKVYNVEQEANEEKIDFQEILFKYLIHWPWFVGTVVVFFARGHGCICVWLLRYIIYQLQF